MVRAFSITRELNPTFQLERMIRKHPSLSVRTLHNNVGGGKQSHIMYFQGNARALDGMKRTYLGDPPDYMETLQLVQETRAGVYLFCVERAGEHPLDLAFKVETKLGPDTVCTFHKSIAGTTWHFVTLNDAGVADFLQAIADAEAAWVRETGEEIPRYRLKAWHSAGQLVPPQVALTPQEETLLTLAVRMGYYEQPKRCKIGDIAARMEMPSSTAHYHLKKAERKALASYADLPPGRS